MPPDPLPWDRHINLTRPLALAPPPIFHEVSATVLEYEEYHATRTNHALNHVQNCRLAINLHALSTTFLLGQKFFGGNTNICVQA